MSARVIIIRLRACALCSRLCSKCFHQPLHSSSDVQTVWTDLIPFVCLLPARSPPFGDHFVLHTQLSNLLHFGAFCCLCRRVVAFSLLLKGPARFLPSFLRKSLAHAPFNFDQLTNTATHTRFGRASEALSRSHGSWPAGGELATSEHWRPDVAFISKI